MLREDRVIKLEQRNCGFHTETFQMEIRGNDRHQGSKNLWTQPRLAAKRHAFAASGAESKTVTEKNAAFLALEAQGFVSCRGACRTELHTLATCCPVRIACRLIDGLHTPTSRGNRLTTEPPALRPASRSTRRARTRSGVILGSLPFEMMRMNAIHRRSFGVSYSQASPKGRRRCFRSDVLHIAQHRGRISASGRSAGCRRFVTRRPCRRDGSGRPRR